MVGGEDNGYWSMMLTGSSCRDVRDERLGLHERVVLGACGAGRYKEKDLMSLG